MINLFFGILLQLKVLAALSCNPGCEPELGNSFIAGYESNGRHWTGTLTTAYNVGGNTIQGTTLPYMQANGYQLMIRNIGVDQYNYFATDSFYYRGIQVVTCSGNNAYHVYTAGLPLRNIVICGAGNIENLASYHCEFFDIHPFSVYPITSLSQGSSDTLTVVLNISINGGFQLAGGYAVDFSGVTGYSNNPSGTKILVKFVNDGQYNKFKIIHNLGSGSLTAGTVGIYYESYSHAYIAGKMACIKDSLHCSWWEARYRMRMTASNNGSFTTYDGYGKPNLPAALAFSGPIPDDPYNTIGSIGNISAYRSDNEVYLHIDTITNALKYEIYNNNELMQTVYAPGDYFSDYHFPISRKSRLYPARIWYRGIRGNQETSESEKIVIPFFQYYKIRTQ